MITHKQLTTSRLRVNVEDRKAQLRRGQAAYRHRHAETLPKARRVATTLLVLRQKEKSRWLFIAREFGLADVAEALREFLTPDELAQLTTFLGLTSEELQKHLQLRWDESLKRTEPAR